MKAVVFDAHGPLENMRYRDAPDPSARPKDCVIRNPRGGAQRF